MSNINFTCPHCSYTTQLASSTESMKGNCPSCKAEVLITPDNTQSEWHPTASGLNPKTPAPQSDRVATFQEKVDERIKSALLARQQQKKNTATEVRSSESPKRAHWFDFRIWSLRRKGIGIACVIVIAIALFNFTRSEGLYKNRRTQEVYDAQQSQPEEKDKIPADVHYAIINEEVLQHYKRSLDIKLNKEVTKDVLNAIANEIKAASSKEYDKTFIGYYLPGDDTSGVYWATTHFTPNLQVKILSGSRITNTPQQKVTDDSSREVVGSWRELGNFRCTLVISKKDSTYFLKTTYNDGSGNLVAVRETKGPQGQRFEKIPSNKSGDHFLLRPNGELEMRDDEGLIYKCIKLEPSPEPEMPAEQFNEPVRNNDLGSNAKKTITNTIGMTLNLIPAGSFIMGSPASEEDRGGDEYQHEVTISNPFYMQTTEVTQGQWTAVMGTEPWKGREHVKEGPNYAASYINWNDAVAYCKNLSKKEGKTYRLPTEAEWEYACRGGTQTTWNLGTDEKALGDYAWYRENAYDIGERYAHQVGLKIPNAFGLHDMHGNVFEWCDDYYAEDYYQQSPTKDPQGPASGSSRVLRGGSWSGYSSYSRSAFRGRLAAVGRYPDLFGFRLVLELD
jgi:sulfatase modifying factor 1